MINILGRIAASVVVVVVSCIIVDQINKRQLVEKAVNKLS